MYDTCMYAGPPLCNGRASLYVHTDGEPPHEEGRSWLQRTGNQLSERRVSSVSAHAVCAPIGGMMSTAGLWSLGGSACFILGLAVVIFF